MIRMPINEDTKCNDVEEYFLKFAELLKEQYINRGLEI